uniref:Uncharacterized protein n=1 Tax=Podoviridae sp. ctsNK10 TaxID=2826582 RepID=A0A8S5NKE4_9CAUD|nr:MAG TPA: hypothetical protein [Podoviridae sp. ctsNK10]
MRCILCIICWKSTYDSTIDNIINIFRILFSSRIRCILLNSVFYLFIRFESICPICLSFLSNPDILIMVSYGDPVKCSILMHVYTKRTCNYIWFSYIKLRLICAYILI